MELRSLEEQRRQGSGVRIGKEPLGRWTAGAIVRTVVVLAVLVCGSVGRIGAAAADSGSGSSGSGGSGSGGGGPNSLKTVPVPLPGDLGNYIQDFQAATRLGKALFWDVQVG